MPDQVGHDNTQVGNGRLACGNDKFVHWIRQHGSGLRFVSCFRGNGRFVYENDRPEKRCWQSTGWGIFNGNRHEGVCVRY
jgi:hypothetical protein